MTATATAVERQPLTKRQQEVYEFVWMFRETRGYCVSVREVAEFVGSPHNVTAAMCHLWPLKRKGWVTWEPNQSRTLRPVEVVND
jgi:SOS-response transcriptional repressor LexA